MLENGSRTDISDHVVAAIVWASVVIVVVMTVTIVVVVVTVEVDRRGALTTAGRDHVVGRRRGQLTLLGKE